MKVTPKPLQGFTSALVTTETAHALFRTAEDAEKFLEHPGSLPDMARAYLAWLDGKTGKQWRCVALGDTRGTGKGPKRCPRCHGSILVMRGVYGVYEWRGDGRYTLEDAKGTRSNETSAEKLRHKLDPQDSTLVVRFVYV